MTKRRTISALMMTAAATFGLGATAARAEQPASQADLQKQVEQLQSQVKDLQAKRATPTYSASDVDATVDSVLRDANKRSQMLAETGGFHGGWMDDHFTIRSADGNYSLSPILHWQFRSVTNFNEDGGGGGDDNIDNGFENANVRFGFEGNAINKNLWFTFVWNTETNGGAVFNEEAFVQYKFADNFAVKLGQYREMIYHEQNVHDKRQLAVDRSLLNEVLNGGESYVQGIDLLWDNGGNLRADIGFTDGYMSFNTNFQDPPANAFDFGVHGRIEWLAIGKDFRGYNQFTSMGNKSGDFLVIGAGGDWSQNGDVDVVHHNVDAQWNSGPLSVYGAFVGLYTETGGGGGGNDAYDWGFIVQAGYMINSQWEVFARYDYIDLDDDGSAILAGTEDSFHEITVGLNYYLKGHNAKFTVDLGWLPNGSPSNQTQIGVLANDGEDQFYVRGQFQLVL